MRRVAGILNVSIDGVEGESLLLRAGGPRRVVRVRPARAMHAEPSYVLRALGRSDRLAQSSLRLSLGRFTTAAEVERAASRIRTEIVRLGRVSPGPRPCPTVTDDPRYSAEVRRRLDTLAGLG